MSNVSNEPFSIPGYQVTLLKAEHQASLQSLLERCVDYIRLVDGSPPGPSAAASLLQERPEGKLLEDKFIFGVSAVQPDLVGVLDVLRDYPSPGDWWVGLLLLDPVERSQGFGKRIFYSFEDWARQQGARHIFLGVLEANRKAIDFWHKLGFMTIERQAGRRFGNQEHRVLVMRHDPAE